MEVKVKIKDITLQRGVSAEKRLVSMIRSSRKEIPWIKTVRLAGRKLDQMGVDVIVYIQPLEGTVSLKVPIQVKSSVAGLLHHHLKYPHHRPAGVVEVLVNAMCSDVQLQLYMKEQLELIRKSGMNYGDFFASRKGPAHHHVLI
jgi:hypothetical protein